MGILYAAGKAQAEIAVTLQATDWPHLNFNVIITLDRNSGRKNGGKLWENSQQVWSERFVFPSCILCVSASHLPAFLVPLSQIWHCSVVI